MRTILRGARHRRADRAHLAPIAVTLLMTVIVLGVGGGIGGWAWVVAGPLAAVWPAMWVEGLYREGLRHTR